MNLPHAGNREAVAAWTIWAIMLLAGLWFVTIYGFTMPFGDEWAWLPVVAGQEPADASWLWSMHNEHRMVLPRLIYMGLGAATDFDFRAGCFFNIMALGGLSLAMMLTARSIRGHTSVYDAFFPLLLLHWAQYENLAWGFQLNFVMSVVLAGLILLAIVRCGPQLGLREAMFVTLCLVGLGISGLYGLAYLPALACWLAFAGFCRWRDEALHARRDGLLLMAFAGALLILVAVYFVGFHRPTCNSPSLWATLSTTVQFLCGGIGPAAKGIWPVSGLLAAVACVYVLCQLYEVFRYQPAERMRAAGLFFFLGGIGSLALAVGMGRAYAGPTAGFMERYMTLGAPLLCLFYLQFTLYSPSALKIHLQRTLALLMLGLLVVNTCKGLAYANNGYRLMAQLEADMWAGLPSEGLATRHGDDLGFATTDVFAGRLELLRQARLGPYRGHVENVDELLAVQRLGSLSAPQTAAQRACLLPGQSLAQHFRAPGNTIPCRIDVQLSRCRGRRTLEYVNWSLFAVDSADSRRLLAHGAIDMRRVGRDNYVTLTIGPSEASAGPLVAGTTKWSGPGVRATDLGADSQPVHFVLVLSAPRESPIDDGVEIPLYACVDAAEKAVDTDSLSLPTNVALSLKGFLFTKRPCAPVASVARGKDHDR
jgi:hypothetical protein